MTRKSETLRVPVTDGRFEFKFKIDKPTQLSIIDGGNYFNGLIDPGDKVTLKFDTLKHQHALSFEGKGKEKFQFLNSFIKEKFYKKVVHQIPIAKSKKFPFDYMLHFVDSAEHSWTHRLDSIKPLMSAKSYSVLLGLIKGSFLASRNNSVTYIHSETVEVTLKERQKELTPASEAALKNIMKFDDTFSYSRAYAHNIFNILNANYNSLIVENKIDNNLLLKYQYLDSLLPKDLKAPVLTLFLENDIEKLNSGNDIEKLIQNIYYLPKDSLYKDFIIQKYYDATAKTNLKKGMPAPDFVLENANGKKVSLSSFKGKVVYMDFWYGACVPCHALIKALKPAKEHFSGNKNVVFLYISIDRKEVWKRALKKYNIEGVHVYTENMEARHPIIKAYKVNGYPTTCLIDRNGNIFNAHPSNISTVLQKQIEDALNEK